MNQKSHFKRVVVTGYGAVTPLGDTASACWQAIMDKKLGYRYVDKTAQNIHSHFLGLIDNEPSLKGGSCGYSSSFTTPYAFSLGGSARSHGYGLRRHAIN